jgi:hypothetical protein
MVRRPAVSPSPETDAGCLHLDEVKHFLANIRRVIGDPFE